MQIFEKYSVVMQIFEKYAVVMQIFEKYAVVMQIFEGCEFLAWDFCSFIFVDHSYVLQLIFMYDKLSAKTAKIMSLKIYASTAVFLSERQLQANLQLGIF